MFVPRLYLSHDPGLDWLVALEFGRVDDSQPPECWQGVTDDFGWYRPRKRSAIRGFKVLGFSAFDADDPAVAEIWSGRRFDAPALGLARVHAGEIVLRARALRQLPIA